LLYLQLVLLFANVPSLLASRAQSDTQKTLK